MNSVAIFKTDRGAKYLATLCKHFGHKVESNFEGGTGWVQFPFGRCELHADDQRLELVAFADDVKHLGEVTKIVTSHLERFAFREDPKIEWRTA